MQKHILPRKWQEIVETGALSQEEIDFTADGFFMACPSVSDLLSRKGIHSFFNDRGEERRCDRFFDDWHLFSVTVKGGTVFSLLKLREQERDALSNLPADGDTPGVTLCFISFDTDLFLRTLLCPDRETMSCLNREINRVVACRGQRHDENLKAYFLTPRALAPYLIVHRYTLHAAGFSKNGVLPLPDCCKAGVRKKRGKGRIAGLLEENNLQAQRTIADGDFLYFEDPARLSVHEKRAILISHTGNADAHSFAAEIRFHALFLKSSLSRIPLVKKIYESAIRADMTADVGALQHCAPFYRRRARCIRQQQRYHTESV